MDVPTVPLLPLTQSTLSVTTLNPRSDVLRPEVRVSMRGVCARPMSEKKSAKGKKIRFIAGVICVGKIRSEGIIQEAQKINAVP